jgi:hypothetical protein
MVRSHLVRSTNRDLFSEGLRSGRAGPKNQARHTPNWSTAMYDMYPDWGPAQHHPDNPYSHENVHAALQASLDLRDNGGQRPDDN